MFTQFGIWFDGCNNRCRQGFGFDTMALIVMLHHYLAGTFGLSMTIVKDDLVCQWRLSRMLWLLISSLLTWGFRFVWFDLIMVMIMFDWLIMIWWWLDYLTTWFDDYDLITMIWGWRRYLRSWWICYGYIDVQHIDAKVQPSKTYIYRVYLPNRYYFDGFHHRVCVLPLTERMFSLQVGSWAIPNLRGPNESWYNWLWDDVYWRISCMTTSDVHPWMWGCW
jgi:hypothetical protein